MYYSNTVSALHFLTFLECHNLVALVPWHDAEEQGSVLQNLSQMKDLCVLIKEENIGVSIYFCTDNFKRYKLLR